MTDSLLRSLNSFALSLALLLAMAGGASTATAQQPTLDGDEPIVTLADAIRTAESDSQLVALATTLLDAREETEISYSTFKDGMWTFRQLRPAFYGNFFGDPFTATYDARYMRMDRLRRLAGLEVDPLNGLAGMFACNPLSYDPAFGGYCRGFRFASTDFFFLPSGSAFSIVPTRRSLFASLQVTELGSLFPTPTRDFSSVYAPTTERQRQERDLPSNDDARNDTQVANASSRSVQVPVPDVPVERAENGTLHIEALPPGTQIHLDDPLEKTEASLADQVRLPDDVTARMQRKAASLKRKAIKMQIERHIEREYGGRQHLTPRQRFRLASDLAERTQSSTSPADISPQIRERLRRDRTGFTQSDRSALPDRAHPGSRAGFDRSHSSSADGRTHSVETPDVETPNVSTSGRKAPDSGASKVSDEN